MSFHLEIALNVPKYFLLFLLHACLAFLRYVLVNPITSSNIRLSCGVSMNSCCHLYYGDIFYDQTYSRHFHPKLQETQYNACLALAGVIYGTSEEELYQ